MIRKTEDGIRLFVQSKINDIIAPRIWMHGGKDGEQSPRFPSRAQECEPGKIPAGSNEMNHRWSTAIPGRGLDAKRVFRQPLQGTVEGGTTGQSRPDILQH
jgi:hypothetical protein